ncbi:Protein DETOXIFICATION 42 [Camellia lanceoleosa]|uniref:Protein DETOXIFICATION 42 n=1 Tax=Camellia lanceoleosa TaxID=1840588 RepID=A0ACC0IFC7_9ERIC|nr:Protein DETOXIFICATION 42 [Camellia lanceoleosa]
MAEDGHDVPPPERKWKLPVFVFFKDARLVFKLDALGLEILQIAFPAALALAADPIASLIDTAFIGRLGPVQLAAVGVAIAVFNQASKVTIFPLVSITTSFVAEEDTVRRLSSKAAEEEDSEKLSAKNNKMKELVPEDVLLENLEKGSPSNREMKELITEEEFETTAYKSPAVTSISPNKAKFKNEKRHIPSASTALLLGGVLGLMQTVFLIFLAKPILSFMGVKSGSPMLKPAQRYLTLRSLGAPAVLLSLAMQGVFRGFKDTKTPLYATVDLLPPSAKDLQFSRFLKNGFLLLARVIAVTFCVTLAASMAARLGPTPMAAFQICLQVWMTSSLLADGLAVAGQAILACAFAEKDLESNIRCFPSIADGFCIGSGACWSCWTRVAIWIWNIFEGQKCYPPHKYRHSVCCSHTANQFPGLCF